MNANATAIATTEARRHQTVITHEPWCDDHYYDVGTDEDGHLTVEGWCETTTEVPKEHDVRLTMAGSNPGQPELLVSSSGNDYLSPDEAEHLARVILRMVAAARAAASGE